ncbi:MAG: ABC transporter permease [Spirochaetaceae bacterium]|nr:ABC transporter permease [Spirochaetaceae bacterium]
MKFLTILSIALRCLFPKSHQKRTEAEKSLLGALFAVGISIVPLVVVMNVSEGMISGISQRLIELSGLHMQVMPYFEGNIDAAIRDFEILKEGLEKIPGVTGAYSEVNCIALAAGKKARNGISLRGLDEALLQRENFRSLLKITEGELAFPEKNSVILAHSLAEKIGASVNDKIRVITLSAKDGKVLPKISLFKVSGIITCGYNELDSLWALVSLENALSLARSGGFSPYLTIACENAFSRDFPEIRKLAEGILPVGYHLATWDEVHSTEFENFRSTKILLLLITVLIILVASINISSALIMLITERQKEIGILKSCGTSSKDILLIFLFVGLLTGFFGLAVGIPLGIIIAKNANFLITFTERIINVFGDVHLLDPTYYLRDFSVEVSPVLIIQVIAGVIVLVTIVSLFPALRAAKKKPVKMLRG